MLKLQRWIVSESVACAELDGEAVLLNIDTGTYFGLDGVGTDIWNLLSGGSTPDDIVTRLIDDYEVDPSQLRSDVDSFLATLQQNGLVRPRDG